MSPRFLTDEKEITGAKKGDNKARLCWRENKRTSEKRCIFLNGEVFFLLTGPLMGDTKISQHV
jgi:hypothetical protein